MHRDQTVSFCVGLTGGIGSGKSAVADRFAELGIDVIDTDAIAHALTTADGIAMPAIRAEFGDQVAAADGALDRAGMRVMVFTDPLARTRLESILHPLIRAESDRRLATSRSPYAILMVPLLVESGDYRQRVNRILVVDCAEATQIDRVAKRNGLVRADVQRILAAQASRAERLAAADDVIDNNGDIASLVPQIERLHRDYLARARDAG